MQIGPDWLIELANDPSRTSAEGLVPVQSYPRDTLAPEQVAVMEKAAGYGADAVFFEANQYRHAPVAQAFVFTSNGAADDPEFAKLHKRLWSWGGVPLVYRTTPGLVQLFRCAHQPDFVDNGHVVCNPFKSIRVGAKINQELAKDPWWDAVRLRNGTIWDDPGTTRELLSSNLAAHKRLFDAVRDLYAELTTKKILEKALRRKLLILSLLIRYLEDRHVLQADDFGQFLNGAKEFFEVLADGEALVKLLGHLEERFNGNIFTLTDDERVSLLNNTQLDRFARFVEGREEQGGQRHLWQLYSFEDLPIELISHIYQLFVADTAGSVYTPPFLVRLMLDEALSWDRLDSLDEKNQIILDPSCGSGVFLVEAYKRLVLHWRSRNQWKRPTAAVLKKLLQKVHGIDLEPGAVELAAFSLCLALCDALEPKTLRDSMKLFPPLQEKTLHHSCFFNAKDANLIKDEVGIVIGNPPFKSKLNTSAAKRCYERYNETHERLPDTQLAYLFLHEAMKMVAEGGVLSMLQQYSFLYNQKSLSFRQTFIAKWDVREILDFISVRGLFYKDTKVVVVVAHAAKPDPQRKVLHATFRRTGRVEARQGFDIDYYDLHWVPRQLALENDGVWRSNLVGGGRVLGFVDRLKTLSTFGQYAKEQGWDYGEGFIEGGRGVSQPASHIIGKPLLPSTALTRDGINRKAITKVVPKPIEGPRSERRFRPPMLLVREHMDLPHAIWEGHYLTYKNPIYGFAAPKSDRKKLHSFGEFMSQSKRVLQAYVAATSTRLFTRKATAISAHDIARLPYSKDGDMDLSENEQILVDDVVDYYRSLVRMGEDSDAMKSCEGTLLSRFAEVYSRQINAIYSQNTLRALKPERWAGVICHPFVFGSGQVDWSGTDELGDKISSLLKEQRGTSLQIARIARVYDGNFIFLVKPDRRRFWLQSIALRDADETMSDLREQGF